MSRRLRVIARLHGYPPDHNAGAEWATHEMLAALAARGHDVRVHLFRRAPIWGRYALDGVQVWPVGVASRTPRALAAGADVLVSHLEGVPYVRQAAGGAGVPAVAVCHNTFDQTFTEAAGVDLAVYNSAWMREHAEKWYADEARQLAPPARALLVRPPVWAADYATEPGDRVTLINLNENKGGVILWQLAERMPDVEFLGVKGSYGDQIIQPGGLPNVEVLEHIPGSAMRERVYARTRVLLALSEYESWGRVAAEAMTSGIPVVAHSTPGLTECLGPAGHFVDRGDLAAIEATVRRLLKPRSWAAAAKKARARSAELDPTTELEAWCEAVEELAR